MRVGRKKFGDWGIELILWFVALVCLGLGSFFALQSLSAQRQAESRFPDAGKSGTSAVAGGQRAGDRPGVEGRVEIRKLGLSVPILSDCSDESLRLGSCHVPGTAVAGGLGNMGIAGHRDGSFRPLRNIKPGDEVVVTSAEGRYRYVVKQTTVVPADDVSVLAIGDEPELTLITCFPFHYVGTAPKRFIVHARLISADGGA